MTNIRVCVIGAGLSGLAAIKCMLETGLQVTCLERETHIGGRWNKCSSPNIPPNTITNTPSHFSSYSDFPMDRNQSLYLTVDDFCSYFEEYATHFNLHRHIRLGCNVTRAQPILSENGNIMWKVMYKSKKDAIVSETYDKLVVCSGMYWDPYIPIEVQSALNGFDGEVIHCVKWKGGSHFEGKKVVVIGLGNTGGDVVSESAAFSKKAYLSTSHGAHVLGRVLPGGQTPLDVASLRLIPYLPTWLARWIKTSKANAVYDHDKYCLTPTYENSVIINDELMLKIACGKVEVKPGVRKSSGNTIFFDNDTHVDGVDAIILCTGYQRKFPFFDHSTIQIERNRKFLPLYKGVFTTSYSDSLAFIGMFSVFGPVVSTSEMQCRYAAHVFQERIKLPSKVVMEREISQTLAVVDSPGSAKESNHINHAFSYYDDLAAQIGCKPPSFWYMLMTDPQLAWKTLMNYSIYEYRLVGPNSWPDARDTIIRLGENDFKFTEGYRKI